MTFLSPREARQRVKARRQVRAVMVATKLRPLVEAAIEKGANFIDWQAPFRQDQYGQGQISNIPSQTDNLVDAQHDGLNIIIAELEAAGWCNVYTSGEQLRWAEPPEEAMSGDKP